MYESKIVEMIAARLEMGRNQYGDFNPYNGKNWAREALEEVLDALVYCTSMLIQIEESMSEESKRKIGVETIHNLNAVVAACEKGKKLERQKYDSGCATAIRAYCALEEQVRERIAECDGTTCRQRRDDLERVCTTRTSWFPERCPDIKGVNSSDFQLAVNRYNHTKIGPRSGLQCGEHVELHQFPRAKCHDPEKIAERDAERAEILKTEIMARGGAPISIWRASKICGLRCDVIHRLWGKGVDLNADGLVEVKP